MDIRYYGAHAELDGIPVVISRTGWTGEVGYEIYLRDPSRGDDLWDRVMEAGRPRIRPIAPCEARRIEAGIFNYGSDMTIDNNPFEIMGLERLVEPQDGRLHRQGRAEAIRVEGVNRKLVGIEIEGDALRSSSPRPGRASTTASRSERSPTSSGRRASSSNIGYVWLPIELVRARHASSWSRPTAAAGQARTAAIPFLDPKKAVPSS